MCVDWELKRVSKYGGYEANWDYWSQFVSPLTSRLPYMMLPGNHEATCDETPYTDYCPSNFANFTAYRYRVRMPYMESNASESQSMWYSFDYSLIHFIALDSESDFTNPPDIDLLHGASSIFPDITQNQTQWLQNDLARVNRTLTPYIVVGAHRSMYTSSASEQTASANLRAAFESLLIQYNVTLYLNGHIHSYVI